MRAVLLPPEIPAFAGMTDSGRTFPVAWGKRCVDRRGSAPLSPGSGDVACRPWSVGLRNACLQPSYAQASGQAAAALGRVTFRPLEVSPSRRPHSHGTRQPPGSGGLWPEVTLFKGSRPKRRPHSSPTRRRHHRAAVKPHAEICTLWAKLPSHACRGASRRSCPLTQVSERIMRTRFVPLCQVPFARCSCVFEEKGTMLRHAQHEWRRGTARTGMDMGRGQLTLDPPRRR